MKRKMKWLAAGLTVTALISAGAAALAAAGDSTDPLVTLSYLTDIFTPSLRTEMDELVSDKGEALREELDAAIQEWDERLLANAAEEEEEPASNFEVITLSMGERIVGGVGCEVLLRTGTAVFVGNTGFIDCTDGSVLAGGAGLVENHLYMVTIDGRTIEATADTVRLLVRGPYTIGPVG